MAGFALVPIEVIQQLTNILGDITLKLGGLAAMVQGSARPLGQKTPDGDESGK